MTLLQAIILGLVQGFTEFLPVSSSGHLVLAQKLLGVEDKGVTFELLLHFGTLISVIIYFWKPLWKMFLSILPPFKPELAKERKMILLLAIACIPVAFVAFSPLKDVFEGVYEKPETVALLLLITGAVLFIPRLIMKTPGDKPVGVKSAIAMGIGQAFAVLPGISRSGSTIVSGMLANVRSSDAAEFSFLMAIPAIAGAVILKFDEFGKIDPALFSHYMIGTLVAFVSGLAAIYSVLAAIRRGKFEYFGVYCLIAGIAAYCYFHFGPA